jgi:glycosyltransferase involved in cell wall biosynthesis
MKILILATDIYTRGGIARYTSTFASVLGELVGSENVHVLVLLDKPGVKQSPKGFRILKAVAERPTAIAKLRFAGEALRVARSRYDLIICSHLALAPIAAAARLAFGCRYWISCYGIEAWRSLPRLEFLALERAALVLPISHFTAKMLNEVSGLSYNKMRILYNAIPNDFASALVTPNGVEPIAVRASRDTRVVLSVGSLSKSVAYKGFDVVIRALPKVLEAVPNVLYVIVGDGDNKENLKGLAAEIGVGDRVDFAGEVSDAELAAYYRACDIFVLPSRTVQRNGYWEGEGFGFVYIEAALAGKPVIGSRDGGAGEAVLGGTTGLLVDPTSASEVSDALVRLLRNRQLAEEMGWEGRKWAERSFSASSMAHALEPLLNAYVRK